MNNIKKTTEILKLFGINAKKKYGQNFLTDEDVADHIIKCADITGSDLVIEIGPGVGTLTQRICGVAGFTVAIEVDEGIKPPLLYALKGCDNYHVLFADILKVDIGRDIISKYSDTGISDVKVVANLPYYISARIMTRLLSESDHISKMVLMLQKEVAERVCAGPGSRQYGVLSIAVQLYSAPGIALNVKSDSFMPAPKVDSSVVVLDIYKEIPYNTGDIGLFFRVVKAAFSQRRKMLVNSLYSSFGREISRDRIREAVEVSGLKPECRAEEISVEQFCVLSKNIAPLF